MFALLWFVFVVVPLFVFVVRFSLPVLLPGFVRRVRAWWWLSFSPFVFGRLWPAFVLWFAFVLFRRAWLRPVFARWFVFSSVPPLSGPLPFCFVLVAPSGSVSGVVAFRRWLFVSPRLAASARFFGALAAGAVPGVVRLGRGG